MTASEFEPDDPMELIGVEMPADSDTLEAMARCFVEEFVQMGYPDSLILNMFRSPFHVATHNIYRARGQAFVRDLIAEARAQWGGYAFEFEPLFRPPAPGGEGPGTETSFRPGPD